MLPGCVFQQSPYHHPDIFARFAMTPSSTDRSFARRPLILTTYTLIYVCIYGLLSYLDLVGESRNRCNHITICLHHPDKPYTHHLVSLISLPRMFGHLPVLYLMVFSFVQPVYIFQFLVTPFNVSTIHHSSNSLIFG